MDNDDDRAHWKFFTSYQSIVVSLSVALTDAQNTDIFNRHSCEALQNNDNYLRIFFSDFIVIIV